MKRSKILVCLMLALVLVVGMASSAMAERFYFHFYPPFQGCARETGEAKTTGNPYVDPDGSSGAIVETTFELRLGRDDVSNAVRTTGARRSFSYYDGYGGSGHSYSMLGAPSRSDFQEYQANGTWQP